MPLAVILEPFRPDQCEDEIQHDKTRADRKDDVFGHHTRSSAQMETNITPKRNAVTTTNTASLMLASPREFQPGLIVLAGRR